MSTTLSNMRMAVEQVFFSFFRSSAPSFRCATRLMEPKLQTAISFADVFKVISVQRLELCTTPTCCCGLRILHGSLNVIHGCPVSNNIESILRQRLTAEIRLNSLMPPVSARRSYFSYRALNSVPNLSCNSGTSSGEKSVHSPFLITRSMKRSGIQFAVFMSCVRRRSSPVFLRSSKNSSTSRCHVSR